jgi:hypothetical protein
MDAIPFYFPFKTLDFIVFFLEETPSWSILNWDIKRSPCLIQQKLRYLKNGVRSL